LGNLTPKPVCLINCKFKKEWIRFILKRIWTGFTGLSFILSRFPDETVKTQSAYRQKRSKGQIIYNSFLFREADQRSSLSSGK
jgi:hypothetical protein